MYYLIYNTNFSKFNYNQFYLFKFNILLRYSYLITHRVVGSQKFLAASQKKKKMKKMIPKALESSSDCHFWSDCHFSWKPSAAGIPENDSLDYGIGKFPRIQGIVLGFKESLFISSIIVFNR